MLVMFKNAYRTTEQHAWAIGIIKGQIVAAGYAGLNCGYLFAVDGVVAWFTVDGTRMYNCSVKTLDAIIGRLLQHCVMVECRE